MQPHIVADQNARPHLLCFSFQTLIQPLALNQVFMHTFFDNMPVFKNIYPVGLAHGAEARGDDDGGAVFQKRNNITAAMLILSEGVDAG